MSGTEGVGQFFLRLFPLLMIMAGAGDVMTRRIPNALIIGTVVLFFPAALVTGMPLWIMSLHVATAALLLLLGFGLFSFGVIGGGDAKMMAAAGLWLGFPCSILFVTFFRAGGRHSRGRDRIVVPRDHGGRHAQQLVRQGGGPVEAQCALWLRVGCGGHSGNPVQLVDAGCHRIIIVNANLTNTPQGSQIYQFDTS